MKVLVKWKLSLIIPALVLTVFAIMITGHFSGEELSSLGKTGSTRNGVITYLNSADVSFSTPKTDRKSVV